VQQYAVGVGKGSAGDAFAAADGIRQLVEELVKGLLTDGINITALFDALYPVAEGL